MKKQTKKQNNQLKGNRFLVQIPQNMSYVGNKKEVHNGFIDQTRIRIKEFRKKNCRKKNNVKLNGSNYVDIKRIEQIIAKKKNKGEEDENWRKKCN